MAASRCPICNKSFGEPDVKISIEARNKKAFKGRYVAEIAKCKRCGAMYCFPVHDDWVFKPCLCCGGKGPFPLRKVFLFTSQQEGV